MSNLSSDPSNSNKKPPVPPSDEDYSDGDGKLELPRVKIHQPEIKTLKEVVGAQSFFNTIEECCPTFIKDELLKHINKKKLSKESDKILEQLVGTTVSKKARVWMSPRKKEDEGILVQALHFGKMDKTVLAVGINLIKRLSSIKGHTAQEQQYTLRRVTANARKVSAAFELYLQIYHQAGHLYHFACNPTMRFKVPAAKPEDYEFFTMDSLFFS